MLDCFYPDQEAGNAYDIEYEELYRQGYRGVIFDIDNTLVPHDAAADGKAKALFHRLRKIGFKTLLLSNNKEPRVKSFCREVFKARILPRLQHRNGCPRCRSL